MPKVFFHLVDGQETLLDPEGSMLTLDEAVPRALKVARALIADGAVQGRIDLRPRIDIADEAGTIVHSLDFADAITIVRRS